MGHATVSSLSSMKHHPICRKNKVLSTVVEEGSTAFEVVQKDKNREKAPIEVTTVDLSLMVPGLVKDSAIDLSCSKKKEVLNCCILVLG